MLTISQLDALAEKHLALPTGPKHEQFRPLIDARTARNQVVGMMKWTVWMSGGVMRDDVGAAEMLVARVDELEDQNAQQRAYIKELETALANVSAVLEPHAADPFDLKPSSKWNKGELGTWILAARKSIEWVMLRAENALDPKNAVPIIPGPMDGSEKGNYQP